ncbi:hypothetical protein ACFQ08_08985 [Streptosporangium algeriense]|uniref:Uncharacterized protein n=1 Tax=Streptosporangium algeriense TaxID=1682748 RepID=A0ABW3DLD1_9ACTN
MWLLLFKHDLLERRIRQPGLSLDRRVARGFRQADREQQFLLPVDMREWLPDDHVVWVLLEVVEHLDVTELEARYAQAGPVAVLTILGCCCLC